MNIYVNNKNGTDSNESKILKTLDYALDKCVDIDNNIINIILDRGDYKLKLHHKLFNSCKIINIKGKDAKTKITQIQGFYSNRGGGSTNFTLNIYNLIYNIINNVSYNWNSFSFKWNFYNIVFDQTPDAIIFDNYTSIFLPKSIMTINNCIKNNTSKGFLRSDNGNIFVNNSYGCFTNGWNTKQSDWDCGTNIITDNPLLDINYKIIDNDNNLYGVYSGNNAWKSYKYLINQDNKYYSIKEEYFKNNNYIPLKIADNITDDDFEKYGFDNLDNLLKILNITVDIPILNIFNKFKLLIYIDKE